MDDRKIKLNYPFILDGRIETVAFLMHGGKRLPLLLFDAFSKIIFLDSNNLFIYAQNNFELIKKHISEMSPDLVIVDSIQAIYTSDIQSSAGSVSQIRECCNSLMNIAKTKKIPYRSR